MAAIKIKAAEIFQNYLEQDMVIQENASNWPWMVDSNSLVCNMLENVGSVTLSVNMVRELTKNVICHVRRTQAEPAVLDGETASSN